MRKLITTLLLLIPIFGFNQSYLRGRVQIVEFGYDYKVRIVTSFPDLYVKQVYRSPSRHGEWQFVDSFPDFKVKFVSFGEDFCIQFVDSFPGLPNRFNSSKHR